MDKLKKYVEKNKKFWYMQTEEYSKKIRKINKKKWTPGVSDNWVILLIHLKS